ncbi:rhodanese-like domain-containing protein [Lacinutrix sp. MEBiC02404]
MKYIISIFFITTLLGLNSTESSVITVLSSEDFKGQTENLNVQLIDVRTPREYETGHISEAINIDFYANNFSLEFNKLNKDQAVYIYCRSGRRSSKASKKLEAMGFTEIYDLKGGILNYN